MSDLLRLLDPRSIAIVGLSSDPAKHGRRVLGHLRRLGYPGRVWGVNPRLPDVEGVEMHPTMEDLPEAPDLVVAAVPARAVPQVAGESAGAGGMVVFAGGFAEMGPAGGSLQEEAASAAASVGVRLLGPNSGGLIRPGRGVAASFLTCLEREAGQIRSGPVGLVTQSGGTGSYLHNLAAGRGDGLAISIATGNEADIAAGEAIGAVAALEEVEVVVAILETLRDGRRFIRSVQDAHRRGKRVVVCRLGEGRRAGTLLGSHTGALAIPSAVLEGVFASLGVITAETPGEAFEVASIVARASRGAGRGAGIVTHSGGTAILLADLAERDGLELPEPGDALRAEVEELLDHGTAANPLDMGGIIGGPSRFARVVERFAGSGRFGLLLAVSTAHPPAHTAERVRSLLSLSSPIPLVHLWMAGDQAADGLAELREARAAVTEEPRAAIRALAGLAREPRSTPPIVDLLAGPFETWGLPLEEGVVVASPEEAARAAGELGFPVVVKAEVAGLGHKSDVGGVRLDVRSVPEVERAFVEVREAAAAAGGSDGSARIQRHRPGLEVIVGGLVHESFGPLVTVGIGGLLTEVLGDVAFAPAPLDELAAGELIDRLGGRRLLDGFRNLPPADVGALARIVSVVSRGVAAGGVEEVEVNPLIWDGGRWVAVDWLVLG